MDKVEKKDYVSDNIADYHYIVLIFGTVACGDFS
jgi:hypothetical protein